jgi:hypothetical protein
MGRRSRSFKIEMDERYLTTISLNVTDDWTSRAEEFGAITEGERRERERERERTL